MSQIQIYNTLSRSKEPLEPITPGKVGIYLCGPTVYDKAHIGHMVGPVVFDTIKRYLTYSGLEVTWVVNITDVDDKLINKSLERGIPMAAVAEEMTADYLANLAGMGVDGIDHMPKATECMEEIIQFTQSLVEKGFAYDVDGDVFFDVTKDPEYGKLTNRAVDSLQGEGGEAADRKRSTADFALWKRAKSDEPSWDSPWGLGRPGWHIECSAMSRAIFGESFDIHGGGLDLIFPHHENEIAQSECCHGKPMATTWMHNGLLRAAADAGKVGGRADRDNGQDGESQKMSRSKGAGGLSELIQRKGGERLRFFLLRTHYRSIVLFGNEAIDEAGVGLETFYRLFKRFERITGRSFYKVDAATKREAGAVNPENDPTLIKVAETRQRFLDAMDDDFNTAGAIGELFGLAGIVNKFADERRLDSGGDADPTALGILTRAISTLRELASTLGLFLRQPASRTGDNDQLVSGIVSLLIELRDAARQNKDFGTADRIRSDMSENGIVLEDRSGSTDWSVDSQSDDSPLGNLMNSVVDLRKTARENKDFDTADKIRATLSDLGVALEDRPDGTDWSVTGD